MSSPQPQENVDVYTDEDVPIQAKLILIGNMSVGKTSLMLRFSDELWQPENTAATIHVNVRVVPMYVERQRVELNIWDTAGEERFHSVAAQYYRGAHGVFLVYDVADRASFDALPGWAARLGVCREGAVRIVVGNKADMESSRQVPTSEGQAFATSMDALFVEASAKDNVGVQQAFHDVVERILNTPGLCERTDRGPDVQESVDITQTPETAPQAQGGGCRC